MNSAPVMSWASVSLVCSRSSMFTAATPVSRFLTRPQSWHWRFTHRMPFLFGGLTKLRFDFNAIFTRPVSAGSTVSPHFGQSFEVLYSLVNIILTGYRVCDASFATKRDWEVRGAPFIGVPDHDLFTRVPSWPTAMTNAGGEVLPRPFTCIHIDSSSPKNFSGRVSYTRRLDPLPVSLIFCAAFPRFATAIALDASAPSAMARLSTARLLARLTLARAAGFDAACTRLADTEDSVVR
mmetsp:Transcript_5247/g.20417  ORF Transcript_5247/g.20417 Transcript_5247/m.20417 type:complete len:237 (-) Transcript_5247:358-1068(-)